MPQRKVILLIAIPCLFVDIMYADVFWLHFVATAVMVSVILWFANGYHKEILRNKRNVELYQEKTKALAESEEKLRNIIDLSPAGTVITDIESNIKFVSRHVIELFKISSSQDIAKIKTIDLVAPEYKDAMREIIRKRVEGQDIGPVRWRGITETGESIFIETNARVSVNVSDGSKILIYSYRDVTNQIHKETELIRAKQQAEDANSIKSHFLAVMSHELRTPLTGVIGMADLLITTKLSGEQLKYAQSLRSSAKDLLGLLNDILDFSKIEAGKIELEEVSFDPNNVVEEVFNLMLPLAKAKNIELLKEHITCSCNCLGDYARLRQILINLVSNAIKFTPSGFVKIKTSSCDKIAQQANIEFIVEDSGIGINPNQIERLFDPFTQADSSTSRRYGGTGLGLAICKRLTEMMQGQIKVESTLGKGTKFTLAIPFKYTTNLEVKVENTSAKPNLNQVKGLKILVAEDNPVNQMLLSAGLRKLGHFATCVDNGKKALEAVQKEEFAAILMDMQMPEMGGDEATVLIRKLEGPVRNIPIIAISADAVLEHRERYMACGLDEFLTKPVDWALVDQALNRLFECPKESEAAPAFLPKKVVATLIDEERLAELKEILGDGIDKMFATFRQSTEEYINNLRASIDRGDNSQVAKIAHTIKGAASNMAAPGLAKAAKEVQVLAETQASADEIVQKIEEIKWLFKETSEQIQL